MAVGYLKTKLQAPVLRRSKLVHRDRLMARLEQSVPGSVVLVSAPVCWYSIDESDDDPVRFVGYLISALQTIEPQTGRELEPILEPPEPPESVVSAIASDAVGEPDSAVTSINRAANMAAGPGFVQPFVDEAADIEPLLRMAIAAQVNVNSRY